MGASVLEAVTRVGVALAAAFIGADVGLFPWKIRNTNKYESETEGQRKGEMEGTEMI